MNSQLNKDRPLIMHVDLNSCFASIEQQSRPPLRGRPVAVVNRRVENTAVVTASYEAKDYGVKTGMRLVEARRLCPPLVALESDPPKYRYVYRQLLEILGDYSAHVRMKSIDEGVIDFSESSQAIIERGLVSIAQEIKQRLKSEVGIWMRCNIGIGPNRFLAKTAAGLNKPDGLDVINHQNLQQVYQRLKLTDLTGIAEANQRRLAAVGIYTPLGFLEADEALLSKLVFKSIDGRHWHQRLRGHEVDKRDFPLKSAGRQYVLDSRQLSRSKVLERLHHLCEEVGYKVRSQGLVARGVRVHVRDATYRYWQNRRATKLPFYTDQAIYDQARQLLEASPWPINEIGITCYNLEEPDDRQLSLMGDELAKVRAATGAIDEINRRYGQRSLHSAHTLNTNQLIRAKVPFGSTRYM